MKKPKCWCGETLIEEVDGFPLGFLNCPVHTCYYEEADRGHKKVVKVRKYEVLRGPRRRTV